MAAEEGLEQQILNWQQRQRRYGFQVVLTALFFASVLWVGWDYRDSLEYSFSGKTQPLDVGDVVNRQPGALKHNSYVSIRGITEHRGLLQKRVRGLDVVREDLWYFRLLGSRGVFIEVVGDKDKYGTTTAVNVTGRVVDPNLDATYDSLFRVYGEKWFPKQRNGLRIIQVGIVPGQGQTGFLIVASFLVCLAFFNLMAIIRLVRERKRRPVL